jgi:hypothetical protein
MQGSPNCVWLRYSLFGNASPSFNPNMTPGIRFANDTVPGKGSKRNRRMHFLPIGSGDKNPVTLTPEPDILSRFA